MNCLICLDDAPADYHPKCLKALFGTAKAPRIDVDLAKLHTLALAMVGHTSISGVQRKLSVRLEADRTHLRLAVEGGHYILKPQAQTFPMLPENEHLTTLVAKAAGIATSPFGLVRLLDGSLAYVTKRFDRTDAGKKLLAEDFCQLAELSPKEKYSGSAELCARLTLKYASEPIIESLKLFRLVAFGWWTGNGDMHLKNFSLLREEGGVYRLSPAYDLLCTRLVIPDDPLALSVAGNKKEVTRRQWLEFAEACRVPAKAAQSVLKGLAGTAGQAMGLIERSYLPAELKASYADLIRKRTERLAKS